MLSKHLIPLIVTLSGNVVWAASNPDIGKVWFDKSEKCAGQWDAEPSWYTDPSCIDQEVKGSVWIYGPYENKEKSFSNINGCMYLYPEPGCWDNEGNKGHTDMWSFRRYDQCANIPKQKGLEPDKPWGSVSFEEKECDWGVSRLKSDCVMDLEYVPLENGTEVQKPILDTCTPDGY